LINSKQAIITEEYERAIIANMFALLEWCMSMPLDLLKEHDRATLLKNNFKLITHICLTFGRSSSSANSESSEASEHIHLSARFIITHLLNHLNFFPYGPAGPAKVVSSVNELSDLSLNFDELSTSLYEQHNVQFFTVNNQFLCSFIELPMTKNYEHLFNIGTDKLKKASSICRFVVRDFCGKICWDCCLLNSPDHTLPSVYFLDIPDQDASKTKLEAKLNFGEETPNVTLNEIDFTQLPRLSSEQMPRGVELLESILQYVNFSSPECRLVPARPLNIVWDVNSNVNTALSIEDLKQKMSVQAEREQTHVQAQLASELDSALQKKRSFSSTHSANASPVKMQSESSSSVIQSGEIGSTSPPRVVTSSTQSPPQQQASPAASATVNSQQNVHYYFNLCKTFMHQMGLLSWEKRQSFNLLHKSSQLLRELKSLDDQTW
jgi:hypothetical protein